MTIERDADDVARCFLLERELVRARLRRGLRRARSIGLIGAGRVRRASATGYEGLLPVRRLRGDWWELNEEGTILARHAQRRRRSASATRSRVRVERVEAPRGRVDLLPVEL